MGLRIKTGIKYLFILSIIGLLIYFTVNYIEISNIEIKEDTTEIGNKIMAKVGNTFFNFGKNRSLWTPMGASWTYRNKKAYPNFWKEKKTEVKEMIEKIFKPDLSYSDKAVIHFRCSDVPFDRLPEYTLYPKEYFEFVAKEINKRNIKEIVFLNCTYWRYGLQKRNFDNVQDPEKLCNNYIETIADWIQEKTNIPVNRNKICTSVGETYSIMLGARVLISTGGSFSFVPGVTKDKDFITHNLTGEYDSVVKKHNDLHKRVHWTMWEKNDIIRHGQVKNYNTFDYKNFKG